MRFIRMNRDYLFIGLASILWLPNIQGGYFLSDDFIHLVDWCLPPFADIWQWFYREYAGFYRPMTALFWKLEYSVWGLNTTGYRLVNIAIHTGCALLVCKIARSTDTSQTGLLSGIVFLFLPGHIFGVLMISALTGLLCTLFFLASFSCYLKGRSRSFILQTLSVFFFVLSLLTKELALSLPLLIVVCELIFQFSENSLSWAKGLRNILPHVITGCIYIGFRYLYFGHLPSSPLHETYTLSRLLINAVTYGAKIFTPWGLERLKPFFRTHPSLLLGITIIASACVIFLLWHKRSALTKHHAMALYWIAITLLPVVRLYSPWNTYLPGVGGALIIASLARHDSALTFSRFNYKRFIVPSFVLISLIYSLPHQLHWRSARILNGEFLEQIAEVERTYKSTFYLVNLPAEWSEAPLLVGDWALQDALRVKGAYGRVVALSNVIKHERKENIKVSIIDSQRMLISLESTNDFFRLDTFAALSHSANVDVGYSYTKAGVHIEVKSVNAQGQPNSLEIDMGSTDLLSQAIVWEDNQFKTVTGRLLK